MTRIRRWLAWARPRVTRKRVTRAGLATIAAPFVIVAVVALFTPLPPELRENAAPSLRVVARDGKLLREVRADDGARARPLPLDAFPKRVTDAVLAAEDRHFYWHPGVDVIAVVRAIGSNIVHRRVVSGASTITMQLARTVRPHPKSLWGKIREAGLAVRIEASLSKDQILEQYLNRVIYGPNLRGYAAASQAYFDSEPNSLSLAQAALIAGLPRGPSLYQVTKRPDLARRRRDRVLERMADAGLIENAQRDVAVAEPVVAAIDKPVLGAPHLVRGIINGSVTHWQPGLSEVLTDKSHIGMIKTTIDLELQRAAENAVVTTLSTLTDKHVTAASVVVLENSSGDIRAWVGSPGFYDEKSLGQNDGVVALRQPGSSLKPFVYAEAMTQLGYTPATILPDVEIHIPLPGGGDYVPHDYDEKERGPVRLREALGSSLNIPAVDTIRNIGTENALNRLHAFGFESLTEDAEHYGPALALGDGEVTLLELARAYATLARGGTTHDLRFVESIERDGATTTLPGSSPESHVVDERVAAMLADILSDKTARMSAFGDQNVLEFPDANVAAKTGTSKGYRDNVAVGFDRDFTVAVWAGNFDGSSMQGVSGISGAGPIFRAVMNAALQSEDSKGRRPLLPSDAATRAGLARTSVCSVSGEVPTAACPHTVREWLPDDAAEHAAPCSIHVELRVDIRNGLLAGPGCNDSETATRVFERWPAPYTEWAMRTNRPVPPEASPNCPLADEAAPSEGPVITYPFDHAKFVIDPDRPRDLQILQIRVSPESTTISVDDKPLAKHEWPIVAGDHVITAPGAQPVRITVR
jgi:penicillin-binding protein 1C